ncbi:MAG TPA: polysaccharide deacetylase family protein, partial [Pyrinomonadaceae bacterium]|nr:polysaccharide deacetylase family protein [Pyrinomonadaceae bacterium]
MKRFYILLAIILACFAVFFILWQLSKSRSYQTFGRVVNRVETSRKIVALTFDDGPTESMTSRILETLHNEQVRATFFVTGAELQMSIERGRRMVAAGHELGNHSYSHQRMVMVSPSWVRDEIERTDALIREAGYTKEIYFRPPYGKKLFVLPYYLSQTGRTSVTWDIEPDSRTRATAEEIAKEAAEQV